MGLTRKIKKIMSSNVKEALFIVCEAWVNDFLFMEGHVPLIIYSGKTMDGKFFYGKIRPFLFGYDNGRLFDKTKKKIKKISGEYNNMRVRMF